MLGPEDEEGWRKLHLVPSDLKYMVAFKGVSVLASH